MSRRGFTAIYLLAAFLCVLALGLAYYFTQSLSPQIPTWNPIERNISTSTAPTSPAPSASLPPFPKHVYYTISGQNVYYEGQKIVGADAASFSIGTSTIDDPVYGIIDARDKNHAYLEGAIVANIDVKNPLVSVSDGVVQQPHESNIEIYVADNSSLYCDGVLEPTFDRATFSVIAIFINKIDGGVQTAYAKDKNHVYSGCDVLPNADPSTFAIINNAAGDYTGYAKDKNNVYFDGGLLANSAMGNLADNHSHALGADPSTFVVLSGSENGTEDFGPHYAKDANHVYSGNTVIPQADPNSFTVVVDSSGNATLYGKDDKAVYYDSYDSNDNEISTIMPNVDPSTFTYLGNNDDYEQPYIKDKNAVYYGNTLVPGADPVTFTLATSSSSGYDAQDKNHKYSEGKIWQP